MRPATRSVPKALLPVVDRPAVQYAAEEAIAAGVREIVVVADPDAVDLIDRHFHGEEPLPGFDDVDIHVVTQPEPTGLGDAVARSRRLVGDRPFFCLLVDMITPPGNAVLSDLRVAAGRDGSAIAIRAVPDHMVPFVGVVEIVARVGDGIFDLVGAVEKPRPEDAPSHLGIVGRYLFQPEIFAALEEVAPGYGGEVQLTDAIDLIARESTCRGLEIGIELLDIGTPRGYADAWRVLASAHPEWGREYAAEVRRIAVDDLALVDLAQSGGLLS